MRFRPGQSGNPNGRPRTGKSIAERIRQKGGEDGGAYVDILHGIATNTKEPTKIRIEAVKVLMQRGFGAIPQEVTLEEPLRISADEVRRVLEREGLLNEPVESESAPAESERARTERVSAWIAGDWPPA